MSEYAKKGGFREPLKHTPQKNTAESSSAKIPMASKGYFKEDGTRDPAYFCVIISGGSEREKKYFAPFERTYRVKIEFVAPVKNYPEGLRLAALRKMKHYQDNAESTNPDKYFIVTDVDHYRSSILKIMPCCRLAGIKLIISNPALEIWLYYGKIREKPTDFKMPTDPLKISSEFKNYLNQKVKGGVDPRKAIMDIDSAINNAKKNYCVDANNIPKLFATNMFELAEELKKFIE